MKLLLCISLLLSGCSAPAPGHADKDAPADPRPPAAPEKPATKIPMH